MKHIRYLSNNRTVCEDPEGLGENLVVNEYSEDEESCDVCYKLLVAHNKREYEKDGLVQIVQKVYDPVVDAGSPEAVRAFLLGLLFATAFWIGAALMILWIFRG